MHLLHLELKQTKDADTEASSKAREAEMKLHALKTQYKVLEQKWFRESAELETAMDKAEDDRTYWLSQAKRGQ